MTFAQHEPSGGGVTPLLSASAGPAPWGYAMTIGWTLLAFVVSGAVAIVCADWWLGNELLRSLESPYEGPIISIITISSTVVQIIFLPLVIRLKRWPVSEYLGLVLPPRGATLRALALLIALLVAVEGVMLLAGQNIMPPFQLTSYRTAKETGYLPALFAAVVLFAPVGEEIVFRGFLYRGFARRPGHEPYAIAIITLVWMAAHLQYDWVGMLQIFIIGLLLGGVRWWTGSIALTILMHAAANLFATIETVIYMEWLNP
jgi:hypothetical protein